MFPRALRVARIRGVDVRLDPSWLIIAVLVVWSFAARWGAMPGRPGTVTLAMAAAATLGFFGSVLAHELGHAFEARHRRLTVHGVTLFVFGGVTEMDLHTHRPRDEFAVAAIGPWVSLVLAAGLGLVTAALDWYLPGRAVEVAQVTGTLGWVNLGLALFNIVPGAPLDGGRVLRATLWAITRDRHRAQRLSALAGMVLATSIWVGGVVWVVRRPGDLLMALWMGVVGLFMFTAARREAAQGRTLGLVAGHTASLLADPSGPAAPTADAGRLDAVPRVPHDAPLLDALHHLHDHDVVAVTRDEQVVALVDHARANALLRALERGEHPDVAHPSPRAATERPT